MDDRGPALARLQVRAAARQPVLAHAAARQIWLAQHQWQLPVSHYHLTGLFGDRSYLWSTTHAGLDFSASDGTTITAAAAGLCQKPAGQALTATTIETLTDGSEIWYCHQSAIAVQAGTVVNVGQPIGAIGATGESEWFRCCRVVKVHQQHGE